MALQKNDFEAQTVGVSATNANSSASGVGLGFNRGTGSTTVYDNTHPGHGKVGIKMHSASSAACAGNVTVTSTAQAGAQRSFCMDAFPTSGRIRIMTIGSCILFVTSAGKLEQFNGAGVSINVSTGALVTGKVYRIDYFIKTNASTTGGTIKSKACLLGGDTAISGTEFSSAVVNAGTINLTSVSFANNGTEQGAQAVDDYMDDLALDTAATDYLGATVYGLGSLLVDPRRVRLNHLLWR